MQQALLQEAQLWAAAATEALHPLRAGPHLQTRTQFHTPLPRCGTPPRRTSRSSRSAAGSKRRGVRTVGGRTAPRRHLPPPPLLVEAAPAQRVRPPHLLQQVVDIEVDHGTGVTLAQAAKVLGAATRGAHCRGARSKQGAGV